MLTDKKHKSVLLHQVEQRAPWAQTSSLGSVTQLALSSYQKDSQQATAKPASAARRSHTIRILGASQDETLNLDLATAERRPKSKL